MTARHEGGCLCGAVRVVALGAPRRVGICHCNDCRRHHGAMFYAAAIFDAGAVTVTGETKAWAGRHFCPDCGSSVFAALDAEETEVHLGILEDAGDLVPSYECWTVRRAAWLPPFDVARRFLRDRTE